MPLQGLGSASTVAVVPLTLAATGLVLACLKSYTLAVFAGMAAASSCLLWKGWSHRQHFRQPVEAPCSPSKPYKSPKPHMSPAPPCGKHTEPHHFVESSHTSSSVDSGANTPRPGFAAQRVRLHELHMLARSVTARAEQERRRGTSVSYVPRTRRAQVSIKIRNPENPLKPELMSHDALLQLTLRIQSSMPNAVMLNSAVRRGCIAIAFDICQAHPDREDSARHASHASASEHAGASSGGLHEVIEEEAQASRVRKVVQDVVLEWVHSGAAVGPLAPGTSITLQVDNTLLKCTYTGEGGGPHGWKVDVAEELPPVGATGFCLSTATPALLMSAPPPEQGAPQLPGQLGTPSGLVAPRITFDTTIQGPPGCKIIGWNGSEAAAGAGGQPVMQLLARVRGRYLVFDVQHQEQLQEQEQDGSSLYHVQVSLQLPPEVAHASICSRMHLELLYEKQPVAWLSLLLVPGEQASLAFELQELQGAEEDNEEVQSFICDAIEWLQLHGMASSLAAYACVHEEAEGPLGRRMTEDSAMDEHSSVQASSSMLAATSTQGGWGGAEAANVQEAERPESKRMLLQAGPALLQCAVSWGLPTLGDMLVTGLVGSPCHMCFEDLAGLGAAPSTCEAAQPRQSLLWLALQSGLPHMVSRALSWGNTYGGPDFCWFCGVGMQSREHPEQEEGVDTQLLCAVQALPDDNPCLSTLLSDPTEGPLVACARTRACALPGNEIQDACAQASPCTQPAVDAQLWQAGFAEGPTSIAFNSDAHSDTLSGAHNSSAACVRSSTAGDACTTSAAAASTHSNTHTSAHSSSSNDVVSCVCGAATNMVASAASAWSGCARSAADALHQRWQQSQQVQVQRQQQQQQQQRQQQRQQQQQQQRQQQQQELGGVGTVSTTRGPGHGAQATTRTVHTPRQQGNDWWDGLRGAFLGFGETSEADFNVWNVRANRYWAAGCSLIMLSCVAIAVLKAYKYQRIAVELPVLVLYGFPYVFVLIANTRASHKRQAWMRVVRLCRLVSLLLMGLKVVPVPMAMKSHVEMHLEYITDLLIHRVMDQLHQRALLSDRIISITAFSCMYKALDMDYPVLRAVALGLSSMCVGIALDARNRTMYVRHKASHAKCE